MSILQVLLGILAFSNVAGSRLEFDDGVRPSVGDGPCPSLQPNKVLVLMFCAIAYCGSALIAAVLLEEFCDRRDIIWMDQFKTLIPDQLLGLISEYPFPG